VTCGRCQIAIEQGEPCWYCEQPLCVDCWEDEGHCGHPEADGINEVADAGLVTSASLSEALVIA
jgi:hypothetical protein